MGSLLAETEIGGTIYLPKESNTHKWIIQASEISELLYCILFYIFAV